MTEHLEVERTYDVPEVFTLPDLASLDVVASVDEPREHHLVAEYHDTADRRLMRASTALRRRTGGSDAGWHLKTAVPTGRLEVHRPLGRTAKPPAAVRGLVAARTAGAPLRPLATIETHRTVRVLRGDGGEPLAEVCHDVVTATLPSTENASGVERQWTELEVELVDGSEDLLDEVEPLLLSAGASVSPWPSKLWRALEVTDDTDSPDVDDTAGGVVTAHVAALVDELAGWDAGVRRKVPGSVHKARVAVRRLRSILAAYRRLLDREVTDPVRAELKWMAGLLGDARDDEVLRALLVELLDAQPPDSVRGPARRQLTRHLSARERTHGKELRDALSSERHATLWAALHRLAEEPPLTDKADRDPESELAKAIKKQFRRVDKARDRLAALDPGPGRDTALHELRKAEKRLRYTVEVAVPTYGKPAERMVERCKRFQEYAGELHDDQVALGLLRSIADEAGDDDVFTVGHLHGVLLARIDAAWTEADREIGRLEAPKPRAKLT